MITTRYKDFFDKKFEGVARGLIALGITPNQLTLIGLLLGVLACVFLILTRNLFLFSLLAAAFGCVDALDGLVARLTQKVSKFGSYLDALCDRYYEAVVVLAVAYVTGYWVLSFMVITGSLIVSYAKARASMEVPVSNTEWPDFMERTERDVIFASGLLLSRIIRVKFWGHDLFFWTLVFLAAAIHATAVRRILRARKLILARGKDSSG